MVLQIGDRVLVNMAPFIGWAEPARESIPCRVLTVEDRKIEVQTEHPHRTVRLWIPVQWVQRRLETCRGAALYTC